MALQTTAYTRTVAIFFAAAVCLLQPARAQDISMDDEVVLASADSTKIQHIKKWISDRINGEGDKIRKKKEKIVEKKERLIEKGIEARARADSLLDKRNARLTTDTLWVARPQCTWTLRAKTDIIGDVIHLHTGEESGHPSDYYMTARPKTTVGVSANYKGISLSLSLSPTRWLNDISDIISSLNYYSNRFGGDLTMERIDKFDGRASLLGESQKLGNTSLKSVTASGYYVFNGRRFSYPAVFNATWEQKRSAGSVIVQANFNWSRLKVGDIAEMEGMSSYNNALKRISMKSVSIGAGYAYNLVLPPHWLIHITAQPSIMLWKSYKLHQEDADGSEYSETLPSDNFNLHLTGRVGATYSWSRYFIGLTGVVHCIKTGDDNDISVTDTKWKGRAFFGVRL